MSEPKIKPPEGGGEPASIAQEKPAEKSLLERAKAGEKLTPNELAQVTENVKPRAFSSVVFGGQEPTGLVFSPIHQGAAQLHGWAAHEHHGKEPFRLTLKAYEAALKAAADGSAPHELACSEHLPTAHKTTIEAAKEAAKKGDK